MGTLDGPDHTWKVRNIIYFLSKSIKFSENEGNVLYFSQSLLKLCECLTMQQIQKHQINRQ